MSEPSMMKTKEGTPTLEVDTDEPCPRCGEFGTTMQDGEPGLCMKCATKETSAKLRIRHMTIGSMTIEQAKKEISALLDVYHPEIDASYLACDNDLTVNLKIKLQPHRLGGVDLGVGISFTKSKVNDSVRMRIDERQQQLFREE